MPSGSVLADPEGVVEQPATSRPAIALALSSLRRTERGMAEYYNV